MNDKEIDELLAHLERPGTTFTRSECARAIRSLRADLAAAKADVAELHSRHTILREDRDAAQRDAERYRWLRDEAGKVEPKASTVFRRNEEWVNVWDGLSLDAAIDARATGNWREAAIAGSKT